MTPVARRAMDAVRQGRKERPYRGMDATEDAASRRLAPHRDMDVHRVRSPWCPSGDEDVRGPAVELEARDALPARHLRLLVREVSRRDRPSGKTPREQRLDDTELDVGDDDFDRRKVVS